MVFGSPYGSLRGFAVSRPPLLVFTLCLTAFALTTLWLAYYVRNVDEIQNIDAHRDWQSLLRFLSVQQLCIEHPMDSKIDPFVYSNGVSSNVTDDGNVSVNVLATINTAFLPPNTTYVNGYLPISEWKSLCPTTQDPRLVRQEQLKISFSLDSNITANGTNKLENICVTIIGPKSLLPMADSPAACQPNNVPSNSAVGILTGRISPPSLGERVDPWCPNGTILNLDYKVNPENSVVLSITDRSIINLHLIHTSYFLFVMATTLICYAVIRGGRTKNNKHSLDKVLLDP